MCFLSGADAVAADSGTGGVVGGGPVLYLTMVMPWVWFCWLPETVVTFLQFLTYTLWSFTIWHNKWYTTVTCTEC